MGHGLGKIERVILAAFKANPDAAFTTPELCAIAYPGLKTVEKKHRVAVSRAVRNLHCLSSWFDADMPGICPHWSERKNLDGMCYNRYSEESEKLANKKEKALRGHYPEGGSGSLAVTYREERELLRAALKEEDSLAGSKTPLSVIQRAKFRRFNPRAPKLNELRIKRRLLTAEERKELEAELMKNPEYVAASRILARNY